MKTAIPAAGPRPLVTGAGGFIGAALLPPLAKNFGAVTAGVRRARPRQPRASRPSPAISTIPRNWPAPCAASTSSSTPPMATRPPCRARLQACSPR